MGLADAPRVTLAGRGFVAYEPRGGVRTVLFALAMLAAVVRPREWSYTLALQAVFVWLCCGWLVAGINC
jgi:hypothetical protein